MLATNHQLNHRGGYRSTYPPAIIAFLSLLLICSCCFYIFVAFGFVFCLALHRIMVTFTDDHGTWSGFLCTICLLAWYILLIKIDWRWLMYFYSLYLYWIVIEKITPNTITACPAMPATTSQPHIDRSNNLVVRITLKQPYFCQFVILHVGFIFKQEKCYLNVLYSVYIWINMITFEKLLFNSQMEFSFTNT